MGKHSILLIVLMALGSPPLLLALWPDPDLEPAVARALAQPRRLPAGDNLFNHLAGFPVAGDQDPAQAAFEAVTRVNALLSAVPEPDRLASRVREAWIHEEQSVADPDGLLCSPREAECPIRLLRAREELRALAATHGRLIRRYRALASTSAHRTELQPHVSVPLPDYRTVLSTHRLVLGVWLADHEDGDTGAHPRVLSDLRFLRRFLAQADNLLGKMVATAMVAETLHIHAAMMDGGPLPIEAFPELDGLSEAERDMDMALDSEFRFNAQAIMSVSRDPELRDAGILSTWLGRHALQVLFKPRRSINQAHACFQETAAITRLPASGFLAAREQVARESCQPAWHQYLMNPVGTVLLSVARPDLSRYGARLHDLAGLITLVNLKRAIRLSDIGEQELVRYLHGPGAAFTDPYAGAPMHWNPGTRSLDFTSPEPGPGFNTLPLSPLSEGPSG